MEHSTKVKLSSGELSRGEFEVSSRFNSMNELNEPEALEMNSTQRDIAEVHRYCTSSHFFLI